MLFGGSGYRLLLCFLRVVVVVFGVEFEFELGLGLGEMELEFKLGELGM
jgi:hypothetical protein